MAMETLCSTRRVAGMNIAPAVLYRVDGSNYMRIGCKEPVVMNATQRTEAVILAEKDPTFEWTAQSAINHVHDTYGKKYAPNYMEEILKLFTSKYYSEIQGSQQPTLLEKVAPRTYRRIRYRMVEEMPHVSPVMHAPGPSVENRTQRKHYLSPTIHVPGCKDEDGAKKMRDSEERRVKPKSFLGFSEVVPEGDVTIPAKEHRRLMDDSGELMFIKARLKGIAVGAEYGDSRAETVKRIRALIDEPELTKLDRTNLKYWDIRAKLPSDLTKYTEGLDLTSTMRRALLTDLKELPSQTVRALRDRDLITTAGKNAGPPYRKTFLGERVTVYLRMHNWERKKDKDGEEEKQDVGTAT
jgi:hypothetical protein